MWTSRELQAVVLEVKNESVSVCVFILYVCIDVCVCAL
jgi:hypothetical protein